MSPPADRYAIRPATPADLAALPAIERAAAAQFRATAHPDAADFPLAAEAIDLARDTVWVAISPGGEMVGFAIARPLDGCAYLAELDVHPDHARHRLGARLIDAVAAWARDTGLAAVTLSTFRAVPWNAPYYARLGFRPLPDDALTPGLVALRRAEAAAGLPNADRILMRRALP